MGQVTPILGVSSGGTPFFTTQSIGLRGVGPVPGAAHARPVRARHPPDGRAIVGESARRHLPSTWETWCRRRFRTYFTTTVKSDTATSTSDAWAKSRESEEIPMDGCNSL